MEAGADLMLLHPDRTEEVLVPAGKGSVADPFVSFDGEWVYYAYFHDLTTPQHASRFSSDIYKIHVKTRKIVRLTHQEITPNTGVAAWSSDYRTPEKDRTHYPFGTFNLGPCPLPGGKVIFTSNRNTFVPPQAHHLNLQLFVMDDDGCNVECIGHLNLGMALHPTILKDGRVMFSSMETQGLRAHEANLWGVWTIHPDGTNWAPLVSAFGV
jgi:hypothetical protein